MAATPGREERVAALFLDSGRRMSPGKNWEQVSAHASDLGRARVQRKSGWTGYVAEGGALIQAAAFCTIPAPSLAASHSALPRGRTRSATLKMRWSGRPQRQGNCPPISGADVGEASILGSPLLPTASVTLATAVRMAGCRRLTAPHLHERTLGVRRKPARHLRAGFSLILCGHCCQHMIYGELYVPRRGSWGGLSVRFFGSTMSMISPCRLVSESAILSMIQRAV